MRFRIASKIVPTVKKNFSRKYTSKGETLKCKSDNSKIGPPDETQEHLLLSCPAYEDLHDLYNVQEDEGLAGFFKHGVSRRLELGEKQA